MLLITRKRADEIPPMLVFKLPNLVSKSIDNQNWPLEQNKTNVDANSAKADSRDVHAVLLEEEEKNKRGTSWCKWRVGEGEGKHKSLVPIFLKILALVVWDQFPSSFQRARQTYSTGEDGAGTVCGVSGRVLSWLTSEEGNTDLQTRYA